jgi:hypothetical protein
MIGKVWLSLIFWEALSVWCNLAKVYTGNKYDPCYKIHGFIRYNEGDDTLKVVINEITDETVKYLSKAAVVFVVLKTAVGAHHQFGWCQPETFLYGNAGDLQLITLHKVRKE